jgi:hypothetical protein
LSAKMIESEARPVRVVAIGRLFPKALYITMSLWYPSRARANVLSRRAVGLGVQPMAAPGNVLEHRLL